MKLSKEHTRRVKQSLSKTIELLNKELKYSPDLQNKDQIKFYNTHINKLKGMLS